MSPPRPNERNDQEQIAHLHEFFGDLALIRKPSTWFDDATGGYSVPKALRFDRQQRAVCDYGLVDLDDIEAVIVRGDQIMIEPETRLIARDMLLSDGTWVVLSQHQAHRRRQDFLAAMRHHSQGLILKRGGALKAIVDSKHKGALSVRATHKAVADAHALGADRALLLASERVEVPEPFAEELRAWNDGMRLLELTPSYDEVAAVNR